MNLFPEVAGRPTNSCIFIQRYGDAPEHDAGAADGGIAEFAYVGPDGTEIVLLPGVMRCPERELEPLTEYTVVGPTECGLGERREYGRFSTGMGPDTMPPSAPGPISQSCSSASCDDSNCCGPYTASVVTTHWGLSTDDSGVVLYDAGNGLQAQNRISYFSTTSGYVMFGQVFGFSGFDLAYSGLFTGVRAFDIAGHESAPGPTPTGCPPPPDAAYDPALDAFMPDTGITTRDAGHDLDAGASAAPPSSCACRASRHERSAATAVALIALGTIVRRRRAVSAE